PGRPRATLRPAKHRRASPGGRDLAGRDPAVRAGPRERAHRLGLLPGAARPPQRPARPRRGRRPPPERADRTARATDPAALGAEGGGVHGAGERRAGPDVRRIAADRSAPPAQRGERRRVRNTVILTAACGLAA